MADTKPCPFCAEDIAATAKKCRYCNEYLDGSVGVDCHWEGDRLKVAARAMIPVSACWICGSQDRVYAKQRRFIYTPPWVYIFLVLTLLPALIILLIVQKTVYLALPNCASCRMKWILTDLGLFLLAVVGIFFFPIFGGIAGRELGGDGGVLPGVLLGLGAFAGLLIAYKFLVAHRTQITCSYIEGDVVTLRIPNPSALRKVLSG